MADTKRKPLITILSVEDERVIATYLGHQAGLYRRRPVITAIAWSPDGTHIASGASDGSLHVWEVRRALPLRTLVDLNEASPVRAIAWNGNTLTAICGQVTQVWQV
jgi:WD40 repeat protein